MIKNLRSLLFITILALISTLSAEADGRDSRSEEWAKPEKRYSEKGSRASFDKRLPPVFPGEEVNAGGNKMKVWSTSGNVPVSQAPEPFDRMRMGDLDPSRVGVILDNSPENVVVRDGERRH